MTSSEDRYQLPDLDEFVFDGTGHFRFAETKTSLNLTEEELACCEKELGKSIKKTAKYQEKLFADKREGVAVFIQAMDAAGKDSTVEHVLTGLNPAGVTVTSLKAPSKEELAHDFLWRIHTHLPERGMIGVFNRSHYEDVAIVRLEEMWKSYSWPKRCCDMSEEDFFAARFRQIRDYERYLHENGYRVVKIFLNVGLDEQGRRFLSRIDEPKKNWKFSAYDMAKRAQWEDYQKAYEEAIDQTATKTAPWYIVPADQKPLMQALVSAILLDTLKDIDPQWPELAPDELDEMAQCRAQLVEQLSDC